MITICCVLLAGCTLYEKKIIETTHTVLNKEEQNGIFILVVSSMEVINDKNKAVEKKEVEETDWKKIKKYDEVTFNAKKRINTNK